MALEIPPKDEIQTFMHNACYSYVMQDLTNLKEAKVKELITARQDDFLVSQGYVQGLERAILTLEELLRTRLSFDAARASKEAKHGKE